MAQQTTGAAGLPGCGANSGCAAVASGRWSQWGSVPVARIGACVYLVLAIVAIGSFLDSFHGFAILAQWTLFTLAFAAAGAAMWFVFVQVVMLRRMCLYCNIIHLCGMLGLAILLAGTHNLRQQLPVPASVAGTALAIFIVGQIILSPKLYAVVPATPEPTCSSSSPERHLSAAGGAPPTLHHDASEAIGETSAGPAIPKEVLLLRGRLRLTTADWPLIGSHGAATIIASLFDFTCPTCRRTRKILKAAVELSGGAFTVIELPVPIHPACNAAVQKAQPGQGQACQYARLAIAVWLLRPSCYANFAEYLFEEKEPPPLGLAILRARELTNLEIDPHRVDEQVDARIRQTVQIYSTLTLQKVPQLLLPTATATGEVCTVKELLTILRDELGLSEGAKAE